MKNPFVPKVKSSMPTSPKPSHSLLALKYAQSQNVYGSFDPEPVEIKLSLVRQLKNDDLDRIAATPLYLQMIRNRLKFDFKNGHLSSSQIDDIMLFLDNECAGLFYIGDHFEHVMFEFENDMMLFKLRFEGSSS